MNSFYQSYEWRSLRYKVLRKFGFECMACGRGAIDGCKIHVDHVKPISKFPELSLDEENLQVLCEDCNLGKSNLFDDQFRVPASKIGQEFRRIYKGGMRDDRRMKRLKKYFGIELHHQPPPSANELEKIIEIHQKKLSETTNPASGGVNDRRMRQ